MKMPRSRSAERRARLTDYAAIAISLAIVWLLLFGLDDLPRCDAGSIAAFLTDCEQH